MLILGIFSWQIRVQQASKPPRGDSGAFLFFGKFSFIFKKSYAISNIILPTFQVSEYSRNEMGPKAKKGEDKN